MDLKTIKKLYLPSDKDFSLIDVPKMQFAMIDGVGNPAGESFKHAVKWLFSTIYPIKLIAKKRMGKDFVEPPLECLWWADDIQDLIEGNRDKLKWRLMIVFADWVDREMFDNAVVAAEKKLGPAPESLRMDSYDEGKCVQIMCVGHPSEQASMMAAMHKEFLPENGLVPNGYHHEIYLNDANRVAPEKLKIVLRQPVKKGNE